jgi:hypothetical protein
MSSVIVISLLLFDGTPGRLSLTAQLAFRAAGTGR